MIYMIIESFLYETLGLEHSKFFIQFGIYECIFNINDKYLLAMSGVDKEE